MEKTTINKIILPAKNYSGYNENSYMKNMLWLPATKEISYQIPCLWLEHPTSNILAVFAHGNGMDIGTMPYYKMMAHLFGVNMLFWEYPNYGYCKTPHPICTAENVSAHMTRVMDFVLNDIKWPSENVVLYGHSIGTGPATAMAAALSKLNIKLGALILQSPYTSIKDFVSHIVPSFKNYDWSTWTLWNSLENIKSVTSPTLVLHGKIDTLIPAKQGVALYEAIINIVPGSKQIIFDGVGHNDFDIKKLAEAVKKFIKETIPLNDNKTPVISAKKYRYNKPK